MSARVVGCMTATVGLLLLAAALWLPLSPGTAGPEPPSPAKELAVLPGDCALFFSIRIADVSKDKLARAMGQEIGLFSNLERISGLEPGDVERYTFAVVGNETVEIIRTRKAVETKKLLARLEHRRYFRKDKDGGEVKEEASEKKVGGKTVYYQGRPDRWTQALCVLDSRVFVRGNLSALEAMLASKARQSPELKALLAEAGKHTLVAGFQGKEVREQLRRQASRRFGDPSDDATKDRPDVKDAAKKDEGRIVVPFEMMPYKPLLMARTALLTVDSDEGYRATARVVFAGKEGLDEGEHALKTVLYVFRELIATAPQMDRALRPLASLAEPADKAFKAARVVRKGNTLETSVRLAVSADLAGKIGEGLTAERKRIDEERKKKYADKAPRDRSKEK